MRRHRQATLSVEDDLDVGAVLVGPSAFRPGQVPFRFQIDPRTTPEWRRIRQRVLRRDGHACRRCGRPATDVDHRVELIDGGAAYETGNLQSLCPECHGAKSSESRYRRARRAASSWGRLALCPKCVGSGECRWCLTSFHACTACLGLRFVPERCAERGEIPSQSTLAEVSSLAWAGAEPPSAGSTDQTPDRGGGADGPLE